MGSQRGGHNRSDLVRTHAPDGVTVELNEVYAQSTWDFARHIIYSLCLCYYLIVTILDCASIIGSSGLSTIYLPFSSQLLVPGTWRR